MEYKDKEEVPERWQRTCIHRFIVSSTSEHASNKTTQSVHKSRVF